MMSQHDPVPAPPPPRQKEVKSVMASVSTSGRYKGRTTENNELQRH